MRQTRLLRFVAEALFGGIWMVLLGVSTICAQPSHVRLGVLTPGLTLASVFVGLREGLAHLGYKEGQSITFIMEDTKGSTSNLIPRVAKLLAAKPDLLFTVTVQHALAAKRATASVPIVFAWASDPVEAGLVASYGSSKNNLTGVTSFDASLAGKRLEVLLEMAPKIKRLLVLVARTGVAGPIALRFLAGTANKFGVQFVHRDVANREEIKRVLGEFPKGSIDAIYFLPSAEVRANFDLLVKKAKTDRIPLVAHEDYLVEAGALFSYGPSPRLVGVQAAALVDNVLKGTKPSEIVVETPNKFFFALNLTVAKEIGLKIPRGVVEEADRLVE